VSMKEIKVQRKTLLDAVRKNRETHRTTFLEAQAGFREQVVSQLDRMLKDARRGLKYSLYVGLPEPKDMTNEYDCVIAMLEMSVDEHIEITNQEFSQYVLDQWAWKAGWETSTANYTSNKK